MSKTYYRERKHTKGLFRLLNNSNSFIVVIYKGINWSSKLKQKN